MKELSIDIVLAPNADDPLELAAIKISAGSHDIANDAKQAILDKHSQLVDKRVDLRQLMLCKPSISAVRETGAWVASVKALESDIRVTALHLALLIKNAIRLSQVKPPDDELIEDRV